jgi:predicted nucleotidyltransferase
VNTSLDHLPPRQRNQLAAVLHEIRSATSPEMVILFGSRARGDWVDDPKTGYVSDFDILVVVEPDSLVEDHNLWSTITQRAERHTTPAELNIIIHTIADVNEQIEKGFYFFSDIQKEGIMLHDSGHHHLSEAKDLDPAARREFARQSFERWFESAGQFLEQYDFAFEKGHLNVAAFLLHQTAERFLSTVLIVFGLDPLFRTLDERRIRWPRWRRSEGSGVASRTSSRQGRCGWSWTRARPSRRWRAISTSRRQRWAAGWSKPVRTGARARPA